MSNVTVSGEQQRDSAIHMHVSILPQTPLPSRLPHSIEQSSLCYTVCSCWLTYSELQLWNNRNLTQPNNSPKLYSGAWALTFLWVHCSSFSLQLFQQGLQNVLQKGSLHIWALYHQCSGPILLMWGRRTGTSGYHPITYRGTLWVALEKHLKSPLFPWTVTHQAPLSMGFSRQALLEWVAISSSRGSSLPRDQTYVSCVSCIGRWSLYHWATWESRCQH